MIHFMAPSYRRGGGRKRLMGGLAGAIGSRAACAGVTLAGLEWYGSGMEWADIQKRIREIWEKKKIAKLMPKRTTAPGRKFEYEDELVFEAMLKMVWDDHPMRKPLGHPYPTVHPLYRRIAVLVQSRALDKMWAVYLRQLDKDERKAWRDAFARIQEGERGGVSLGLAWVEILRRGVVRRPRKRKKS